MKDNQQRPYPGLFVALIGADGVGKSTAVEEVGRALNAKKLVAPSHHLRTGDACRAYMAGKRLDTMTEDQARVMALLMAADRAEQYRVQVRPALDAGRIVLCDRWAACSGAYQGSAEESGRLHGYILGINAPLPRPDFTVYLRMDDLEALARRAHEGSDNVHATPAFLAKVQQKYEETAYLWQFNDARYTLTVDGLTPDDVAARVATAIRTAYPAMFEGVLTHD